MKVNFWLLIALAVTFVQAQHTDISSSSLEFGVLNFEKYKHQVIEQVHRVEKLTQHARIELKMNNNIRPTTEYTMDDIVFILKRYLPSWVYPSSIWKQDIVTRRRSIAKTVRSSPLIARPRIVMIRDNVIEWTYESKRKYANDYIIESTESLESLIDFISDFATTAINEQITNPLFLDSGVITLNNAFDEFIRKNNKNFASLTEQVNDEFNYIVAVSGKLRRPLESMREDAIIQTKHIRDELFTKIDSGLRMLGDNIQYDLQRLSRQTLDEDNATIEIVKKLTAEHIQLEIDHFENIKFALVKLKSVISHVWDNASNELVQSPTSLAYYIDVVAEVKEAITELARLLADTLKKYHKRKFNNCSCGWSH